jgi:hypothetical protein
MKRVIALVVFPVVLAGCGSSDGYTAKPAKKVADVSFKSGDEASLMPLTVGNQWVYTIESSQGTAEMTLKVTEVTKEGDATLATMTATMSGSPATLTGWRVDSTGIYQVTDGPTRKFEPPQLLVAFPLELNKEHKRTVTGPHPFGNTTGSMETTVKYVGPQHVDIDGDRIAAMAVESVTTWQSASGPASSRGMTWWTPGVGFVRQRQEVGVGQGRAVVVMKLKSHSFK